MFVWAGRNVGEINYGIPLGALSANCFVSRGCTTATRPTDLDKAPVTRVGERGWRDV